MRYPIAREGAEVDATGNVTVWGSLCSGRCVIGAEPVPLFQVPPPHRSGHRRRRRWANPSPGLIFRPASATIGEVSLYVSTLRHRFSPTHLAIFFNPNPSYDLRQHRPRPTPTRDCRVSASGRPRRLVGRIAVGLHQRRREPEAAGGRPAVSRSSFPAAAPSTGGSTPAARSSGNCCCGPPSPKASSTSTSKTTWPRRSGGSAAPSGSSACMTSAKRPTISTRSTAGFAGSIPTSSRSRRWPTIRTTTCGCSSWSGAARCR